MEHQTQRRREFSHRILGAMLLMGTYYGLAIGLTIRIAICAWQLGCASRWVAGTACGAGALVFLALTIAGDILVLARLFFKVGDPGAGFLPVTAKEQPELFRVVSQVARQLGEPMPSQILISGQPNCFSLLSGWSGLSCGWTGIGFGLPVLAVLEAPQLSSIIAHEFGHLKSMRETRDVWQRWAWFHALLNQRSLDVSTPLQRALMPHLWYARAMMALTWPLAAKEELKADDCALATVGAVDHALALEGIAVAQVLWQHFLDRSGHPSNNRFEDFRRYLTSADRLSWNDALEAYHRRDRERPHGGFFGHSAAAGHSGQQTAGVGHSIMPGTHRCPHPVLSDRIDYLLVAGTRESRPAAPATPVYRPADRIERALSTPPALRWHFSWRFNLPQSTPDATWSDLTSPSARTRRAAAPASSRRTAKARDLARETA